ncbi:metallopeptidase family protein [Enterovirga rhinocerotis]|uniref:Putative Zn-dependent protease with MMP-like domain n=1 Tax=Enterovirga rhinocerotis TaxID=1339210 RepID=A0A4R7BQU7_9HYPH|nr:metallopeptidase family protein [Enterovirga rhinocerotis]TDR87132.1 putative Zn-dependent protease with MMP-like domain [Enterovirga rhinocerotis]
MSDQIGWEERRAPSLDEMDEIARKAFGNLPDAFKSLCDGVVIKVVDFPDDETLEEMEIESPFDLLGLFRGLGLAQGAFPDALQTGQMPNMVWLYRRPILDYWAEHEETLGAIVSHVLIHEIGHHFGLSDDDMERVEAAAG